MIHRLCQVFDFLDGIEVIIAAIIAAILIIVGPIFVMTRFVVAHHYSAAFAVGLLWCACVGASIRDIRRRSFSWITGGLVAVWVITTLVAGLSLQ